MIVTFRTMRGLNRVDKKNWFQFRNVDNMRATRLTVSVTGEEEVMREKVLFMENVRLESRKNFFSIRVINKWNRFPDKIKNQKTLNSFKNRYDEWKKAENESHKQT